MQSCIIQRCIVTQMQKILFELFDKGFCGIISPLAPVGINLPVVPCGDPVKLQQVILRKLLSRHKLRTPILHTKIHVSLFGLHRKNKLTLGHRLNIQGQIPWTKLQIQTLPPRLSSLLFHASTVQWLPLQKHNGEFLQNKC